ncbi:uncharacterized protein LOC142167098 [Nicotiana tabacum]|uniref:Uncharacterized protein LOC142167098 n=1 Tax=Nicotiana tabacum TaxID=4097 RepID=A0AC58SEF3_TOBAC
MAISVASSPSSISNTTSDTTPTHTSLPFRPDDYTHLCHPLYIHPSDLLGSALVSEPFDGTCYGSWRRSVLVALFVRNKLDFIHGTVEKPPEGSPLMQQWQRCNDLVVAWLSNSVTKQIHRTDVYSEYAKDIWRELETRYGQADGARVFELKKELAHIFQGALDIASYLNKIKQLWDELASIFKCKCTCGGGVKAEEEQRVYQFLMGLNDVYVQLTKNAAPRRASANAAIESSFVFSVHSSLSPSTVFSNDASDQHSGVSGLTKEQYSQLMLLLQQSHVSPDPSHSLMASAHFAGRIATHSVLLKPTLVSQGPSLKKPLVLGKLDKGLYKLDITQSTSMPCSSLSVISFPVIAVCSPDSVFTVNPVYNSSHSAINKMDFLWHFRLGHVPFSKMKLISDISSCLSPKQSFPCSVCPLASQTSLPTSFWDDCILTATYLINRFPSPLLHHKSPFELLYGKPPSYSHLRSFGCLCYATVPRVHRDKFGARSVPCVFLVYPFAKKGYKLYKLASKSSFVSRDVIFYETIFPFAQPSSILSTVFPSQSSPVDVFPSTTSYFSSSGETSGEVFPSSSPSSSPPPCNVSSSSPSSPSSAALPSSSPIHSTSPSLVRKSTIPHNPPSYLQNYVCSFPTCSRLGSSLSAVADLFIFEPQSYSQAAHLPE